MVVVKVKVLERFRDRENGMLLREPGDVLEVTKERAEHLKWLGLVSIEKTVKKKTEE